MEPCRAMVESQVWRDSVISCTAATVICMAEPTCHTALQYYNNNCQDMFSGKHCDQKCKNSLHILIRQNKAKKVIINLVILQSGIFHSAEKLYL